MSKKPKILIVDDETEPIEIIEDCLSDVLYDIDTANDGGMCLEKVESFKPDLIFLDINMPGMTGLEVLKTVNPGESLIGVVMVTSISELDTAVEAMKAGAYDYVTKPVDQGEVNMLAKNALERRSLNLENRRLTTELKITNNKLLELDKMKTLLTQFLVHDLKSPLTAIKMNLDMLLSIFADNLTEAMTDMLKSTHQGADQILNLVADILTVAQLEEDRFELEMTENNINELARAEMDMASSRIKRRNIRVVEELGIGLPPVKCDGKIIGRVIGNLLSNAINHTHSEGVITVTTFSDKEKALFRIKDTGCGIPRNLLPKIFDKFSHVKHRADTGTKYSTGLGLTFCKMVVEAHGGEIHVESEENTGSEFTFFLPAGMQEKESRPQRIEKAQQNC